MVSKVNASTEREREQEQGASARRFMDESPVVVYRTHHREEGIGPKREAPRHVQGMVCKISCSHRLVIHQ